MQLKLVISLPLLSKGPPPLDPLPFKKSAAPLVLVLILPLLSQLNWKQEPGEPLRSSSSWPFVGHETLNPKISFVFSVQRRPD